jgi:methyl-accepting chemotaxis protein
MASRRLPIGAAVVLLAALAFAAGCGGDSESAAEQWADSFCTSVADWREDVQATASSLQDTSSLSTESVRETLQDAVAAAEAFVAELRELGPPETETGEQVREEIEGFTEEIERSVADVREVLDEPAGSVAELLQRLASVAGALTALSSAFSQTMSNLSELDPGGELEAALEQSEACRELTE